MGAHGGRGGTTQEEGSGVSNRVGSEAQGVWAGGVSTRGGAWHRALESSWGRRHPRRGAGRDREGGGHLASNLFSNARRFSVLLCALSGAPGCPR